VTTEHKAVAEKKGASRVASYLVLFWLTFAWLVVIVGLALISSETVSDTLLLLAVSLAGGGGAALQASTALVNFIGSRSYRGGWTPYFFVRPLLGAGTALAIYTLLRASFVSTTLPTSALNFHGILAISFLSGLLSSSILVRLTEFYDVLLTRGTDLKSLGEKRGTETGPTIELRRLDRYHGYVVYDLVPSDRPGSSELQVWLQAQAHDILGSQEIDIGAGPIARSVKFLVSVYPEECDVEPHSQALVAELGEKEGQRLRFSLQCPAGLAGWSALVEVSQQGRTVAVVSVGRSVTSNTNR
jgi:hypothetical protein